MRRPLSIPLVILLGFAFSISACGGDGGGAADTGVAPDATDGGIAGDTTTSSDAAPDGAPDTGGPACGGMGEVPIDDPDPTQTKFAFSLFHFNVQYVAGGLSYVDEQGFEHTALPGAEGWDNDKVEDWIIRETFAPVIDFYLAHPQWKANIELQAYMIDVIAERHPDLLEPLRTVTQRGQVELMSFHYSDQLFLAFPREDLERSIAATKATFARHCLPLAGAVFDQEGQAGEGRQDVLVQEGYTVGIFPRNLWKHQYGDAPPWPWYRSRGGDLVVGPGGVDPASGIETEWLLFDDGELLAATGGVDPYFAHAARFDPANLVAYAERIQAKEDEGFRIAHVSDYVRHLAARGVEKREAPRLLDGTWQPPSTRSIHRWLGGRGILWWLAERDNEVRTGNARARAEILFAETLRDHAAAADLATGAADALLASAWRDLWLAEVSDATGINPWAGEIRYGLQHNAAARSQAEQAIALLKESLDVPWVAIDTATGVVTALDDLPMPEPPAPIANPPFAPSVRADGRTVDIEWVEAGPTGVELHVLFSAATGTPAEGEDHRIVEVGFPRTEDRILYSPGLLDDEVADLPFEMFAWSDGEFFLPLGNGLIGLGDGRWMVKHTQFVHLAARLAPDDDQIRFIDETIPADEPATWIFAYVEGTPEDALAVAHRLNVRPFSIR